MEIGMWEKKGNVFLFLRASSVSRVRANYCLQGSSPPSFLFLPSFSTSVGDLFYAKTSPPSCLSSKVTRPPRQLLCEVTHLFPRRASSCSPRFRRPQLPPPFIEMATTTSHYVVGKIHTHGVYNKSSSHNSLGSFSVRLISNGLGVETGLLRGGFHCSSGGNGKLGAIHASTSQSSVADPVQLQSSNISSNSWKKSNETALILIRHGESLWNEKNLFTGCVDVPLTEKGVEEAIEAGKRISNIPVDMIYTSSLIRAQMTAMLAMTQHRRKKVPIIVHNESERAKAWSQVYSEETKKQSIPVIAAWQLNERMYGELQGLNKQETADRFGKQQVHEWRRSYDIPPPNGESLEMCAQRAVAYFKEQIEPQLLNGRNVMIAAHGNSLRSIIMYLDKLTSQEVISLELSTGIPMLYIFKEGKFIRRGSPVGPSEAGVYAYTRSLALYRQKLDEMLH